MFYKNMNKTCISLKLYQNLLIKNLLQNRNKSENTQEHKCVQK